MISDQKMYIVRPLSTRLQFPNKVARVAVSKIETDHRLVWTQCHIERQTPQTFLILKTSQNVFD